MTAGGEGLYTSVVTDSYFHSDGSGVMPFPRAHAPWGDDMLHGRLLGGLAARALDAELGAPGWRAARLTVDLFRPAAMARVHIDVRPIRDGRRIKVADALMRCDGHDVGRATAVFLAESTAPPGLIWRPPPAPWPEPESIEPSGAGAPGDDGWWFRGVQGGFGTGEQTRVWTRETLHLVDDESVSPFVRTALSGDIACPLANSGDQGLHYINADYTMLIGRYPVGEWVGVEVAQQIDADGISMGSATLVDRTGPFATSGGVSLARPPMTSP
ncbi:MAG: acyl-CoA thioesterase domain-containing protein [Ilumatobacteraceae bacterium]